MPVYEVEAKVTIGRVVLAGRLGENISGRGNIGVAQIDTVPETGEEFGRVIFTTESGIQLHPFVNHHYDVAENPFGSHESILGKEVNSSFLRVE